MENPTIQPFLLTIILIGIIAYFLYEENVKYEISMFLCLHY